MYSFSIWQFIWEYIGGYFLRESSLMYSFSIMQFMWECIVFFLESSLMYSFEIRQIIWEYIGGFYDSWMFGPNFFLMLLIFGGGGGVINTMLIEMRLNVRITCNHYSIMFVYIYILNIYIYNFISKKTFIYMHMRARTHAHTHTHLYIYIYICIHLVYATAHWHVMFCLLFNSLQLAFDLVDFESQKMHDCTPGFKHILAVIADLTMILLPSVPVDVHMIELRTIRTLWKLKSNSTTETTLGIL